MTRKDFEFLANLFGTMLKTGELSRGAYAYACSQLDRDYSNFNRAQFENVVERTRIGAQSSPNTGEKV